MTRSAKNTAFEKAKSMRAATRYRDNVAKPRVLSIDRIRKGLEALSPSRQVYVQWLEDAIPMAKLATVKSLLQAVDELADCPKQSAVYVVRKNKALDFSAWPIIWQGVVQSKYILVAYVDPIRYGFDSQSKFPLTIGPAVPMPQKQRQNGLWIDYNADHKKLRFAPRGEVCSSRELTSRYGPYWREVLKGQLGTLPREKGQQQQYEAVSPLPSKEEYEELARKTFTKSVPRMIDDAYEIMGELASELEEAFYNTPDSLQGTDVAVAREEAAQTCADIADSKPVVPKSIQRVRIYRSPSARISSRADRAAEAVDMLKKIEEELSSRDQTEELKAFFSEIDEHASEIEAIEFPGMFG